MKLRVKLLTPRCDGLNSGLPDGLILRTTGEYNGKPYFAKDGGGPPFLWWSGDGLPLRNPTPPGVYYCVTDDGSQGFDFAGLYAPDPNVTPNPPDEYTCTIYKRVDETRPQAWLSAVTQSGPCSDNLWQLVGFGWTQITLFSEERGTNGLPYVGHYGPGPHADPPWVYAQVIDAIPANAWILSEHPNAEALDAAFNGLPYTPWFGLLPGTSPVGEYEGSPYGCWNCRFTLEPYRYPSPACYRVRGHKYFQPSVDLSGDYRLGDPPEYYPEADDNDYPVYRHGNNAIYRHDGYWWIGPAVGEAEGYRTDNPTASRTPSTGVYRAGSEHYGGAHRVELCANTAWWPWCCRPCPPAIVTRSCVAICLTPVSKMISKMRVNVPSVPLSPAVMTMNSPKLFAGYPYYGCGDTVSYEQGNGQQTHGYSLTELFVPNGVIRGVPVRGYLLDVAAWVNRVTVGDFDFIVIRDSYFTANIPEQEDSEFRFDSIGGQGPGVFRARVQNGIPRHLTPDDIGKKMWWQPYSGTLDPIRCLEIIGGPDTENYMTVKASTPTLYVPPDRPGWRFAPDYFTPLGSPAVFTLRDTRYLIYGPQSGQPYDQNNPLPGGITEAEVIGAFERVAPFPPPTAAIGEAVEVVVVNVPDIE